MEQRNRLRCSASCSTAVSAHMVVVCHRSYEDGNDAFLNKPTNLMHQWILGRNNVRVTLPGEYDPITGNDRLWTSKPATLLLGMSLELRLGIDFVNPGFLTIPKPLHQLVRRLCFELPCRMFPLQPLNLESNLSI